MDTMDAMEECLDDISSVLTTCEQLNVSDLQALGRAVYCLKSVCARLVALLNEEASSDGHNLVSRARPFTDSCSPGRKGLVTHAHTFGAPGML